MDRKAAALDKAFIDRQRARLTALRVALVDASQARENEEADINARSTGEVLEGEDDAQRLTQLELDGNLVVRDLQRLALVDRALKKIEDGTYGFSDASGDPIPIERLEAVPEAVLTVKEQGARESR